ncbi:MAG: OmpA family protein [Gemmatimonadetes bacterium]|nr:OmpA family protein [Gemmatimonadota bacterium]
MRQNFNLVPYDLAGIASRVGVAVAALVVLSQPVAAQSFRMPSTLRYGSGLIDVPVAWVLPHMGVTGTFSAMALSSENPVVLNSEGEPLTKTDPEEFSKTVMDGSIAIGIMNRLELGASIQHFAPEEDGGNMLGAFARLSLFSTDRFGVAGGARYVTSPSPFGAGGGLAPGRLGYPDYRLSDELETNLSPYGVATAKLLSSESANLTLTAGYGIGMFAEGKDLDLYAENATGGIFGGAALHLALGNGRLVHLMGEHNGFDINAGVQADLGAFRVGAFAHGLTGSGSVADGDGTSTYLSQKFGVVASIAFPNKREIVVTRDTVVTPHSVVTRDTIVTADTTMAALDLPAETRQILEEMVLFDFDRHALSDSAQAALGRKAEVMMADPGITLLVEGHADERGTSPYNVALGSRRAAAVLAYLTGEDFGLDSMRFTAESKGDSEPIDPLPSPIREPSRNRRVDFSVTGFTEMVDTTITVTHTITETEVVTHTTVITETETILNTRVIGAPDPVGVPSFEVSNTTETVSETTDTVAVEVSDLGVGDRGPGSVGAVAPASAAAAADVAAWRSVRLTWRVGQAAADLIVPRGR